MSKCVLCIAALALIGTLRANGQETPDDLRFEKIDRADGWDEYEERLNAVLKTRLDAEKEYVGVIVQLARDRKIPLKLVDVSWTWARKNRPWTKYPFVYFARIIKLQGDKIGVEVPAFDFSVYNLPTRSPNR